MSTTALLPTVALTSKGEKAVSGATECKERLVGMWVRNRTRAMTASRVSRSSLLIRVCGLLYGETRCQAIFDNVQKKLPLQYLRAQSLRVDLSVKTHHPARRIGFQTVILPRSSSNAIVRLSTSKHSPSTSPHFDLLNRDAMTIGMLL